MKPLKDLIPGVLRKAPQKDLPLDDIVRAAWTALVGRQIADRSHVFRLYRETLIVHVPSIQWQRQLRRMEQRLLGRINDMLGGTRVASLDFRVDAGMVRAEPATEAPIPRKGPGRALDPEVEASAGGIADPELRELFLKAARKMQR